jgi:hypothetical protein
MLAGTWAWPVMSVLLCTVQLPLCVGSWLWLAVAGAVVPVVADDVLVVQTSERGRHPGCPYAAENTRHDR